MNSTGQLIRDFRTQQGLTQEDLAEQTDVSVRTIQRIENGKVEPRAYTIQAIAKALDVPFEKLYSAGADDPSTVREGDKRYWLTLLHISGLFLLFLPPLIIWLWKRKKIQDVNDHGIDILNFQITMLMVFIPMGLWAFTILTVPFLVIGGIFTTVVIILNTIRVLNDQLYLYPLALPILKH